jgi:hypothetical protein
VLSLHATTYTWKRTSDAGGSAKPTRWTP